jgi:hypothetical protein
MVCVPRNFTQGKISLNAYAARANTRAEFDWRKEELISKENITKHPLLSNLIKFISIYFLRLHSIVLRLHRPAKTYVESILN